MKKLVTPAENSARYFSGKLLTGGHHYVLVSEADSYASRQISLGVVEALTVGDVVVKLPEEAVESVLNGIVEEYIQTKPWNKDESTYAEYRANAYIYAAEAYSSELKGESLEQVEAANTVTATEKAALLKAEKAALKAEKAAAEKAAAAE